MLLLEIYSTLSLSHNRCIMPNFEQLPQKTFVCGVDCIYILLIGNTRRMYIATKKYIRGHRTDTMGTKRQRQSRENTKSNSLCLIKILINQYTQTKALSLPLGTSLPRLSNNHNIDAYRSLNEFSWSLHFHYVAPASFFPFHCSLIIDLQILDYAYYYLIEMETFFWT